LISANPIAPRLTRFAILAAAGAATLSLAACGSSNTAAPTQSPGPSSSASAQAQAPSQAPTPGNGQRVAGLIASVSGSTIQVTQKSGTATVDFTPSTTINEVTPGALSDVTAGSCVTVRPSKDDSQGGAVNARLVRVSLAVDGKCGQPNQPPAGAGIQGTVASVAGNTITVNGTGSPTTVTVSDRTKYMKEDTANSQAIASGKCINAQGSQGNGGALQASSITVRPAADGRCPGEGGPHHGHGG
jgi:Domain of unknown function (DUF5666)